MIGIEQTHSLVTISIRLTLPMSIHSMLRSMRRVRRRHGISLFVRYRMRYARRCSELRMLLTRSRARTTDTKSARARKTAGWLCRSIPDTQLFTNSKRRRSIWSVTQTAAPLPLRRVSQSQSVAKRSNSNTKFSRNRKFLSRLFEFVIHWFCSGCFECIH